MLFCLTIPHLPAAAVRITSATEADVAVVVRDHVISATPALMADGCEIGMAADRVRKRWPDAIVAQRDAVAEASVWEAIVDRVYSTTPLLRVEGRTAILCSADAPTTLARLVRRTQASAGMATTAGMARMAAAAAVPGTVLRVDETDDMAMLASWKVDILCDYGVDEDTVERLKLFGLSTILRLTTLSRRHLVTQFGRTGTIIADILDNLRTPVQLAPWQPPASVLGDVTLTESEREPGPLRTAVVTAVNQAISALAGRQSGRMELVVRDAGRVVGRAERILPEPTQDAEILRRSALMLLQRLLSPDRRMSSITIRLSALRSPVGDVIHLLPPKPSVDDVATSVLRRFPGSLFRVNVHDADAYIPERAATIQPWAADRR